jgi:hypothetical protein
LETFLEAFLELKRHLGGILGANIIHSVVDWTTVSLDTYSELKKHLGDIFGGNIIHSVVETGPSEVSTVAWRHIWS